MEIGRSTFFFNLPYNKYFKYAKKSSITPTWQNMSYIGVSIVIKGINIFETNFEKDPTLMDIVYALP